MIFSILAKLFCAQESCWLGVLMQHHDPLPETLEIGDWLRD